MHTPHLKHHLAALALALSLGSPATARAVVIDERTFGPALITYLQEGRLAEASDELTRLSQFMDHTHSDVSDYIQHARQYHEGCATRVAGLEIRIGDLGAKLQELDQRIRDAEQESAALLKSRDTLNGRTARLQELVSKALAAMEDYQHHQALLRDYWWVPGYGQYLEIKVKLDHPAQTGLAKEAATNGATLKATLEDREKNRQLISALREHLAENTERRKALEAIATESKALNTLYRQRVNQLTQLELHLDREDNQVLLRLREDALGLAQFINASGGGKQFQRDDLYREKGTELLRDIGPTLGETLGLLDTSRHHFDDIKAKLDGLSCDR